jgi:secreted trypsin-like serine protease
MTTLTNEQMLKNVITIIKKMDITDEADFDTEMNKVINKAKNGKTTVRKTKVSKEDKEPKALTLYQQFVKDKMPEVKEKFDSKDRMKAIAELWQEQKKSSGSE